MPIILDGKKARNSYKKELISRVQAIAGAIGSPRLAILQIGDLKESNSYIAQKKKFALSIGAAAEHIRFDETVAQGAVAAAIAELNSRADIHGIILQMPIPAHLDALALINLIDPKKDVDGLTDENQRLLEQGKPRFIPATAKGVMMLLDFYRIDVKGKKAVVMGRSRLVGHPLAELLKIRGALVTVCHSKTADVSEIAETADLLFVAIGKPRLVDIEYIGAESTIVVDIGITNVGGALVGDVDFDDIEPYVAAITPVPGGVGPMTVVALFDNLTISAALAVKGRS